MNQTSIQIEPTSTSTTSDNSTGYFSNAHVNKTVSAGTTPLSTPGLKLDELDTNDTCKIANKLLPALLREFPKPPTEMDVQTMLAQKPGRWTIQGQMEANQRRIKTSNEEDAKVQRSRDFEKAKEDLRAQWRP